MSLDRYYRANRYIKSVQSNLACWRLALAKRVASVTVERTRGIGYENGGNESLHDAPQLAVCTRNMPANPGDSGHRNLR